MVLTVNVVNSALVALVLASYMEQTRWWIFFGLVVTLTGVRVIGWSYYRHSRKPVEATPNGRYTLRQDRGYQGCSGAQAARYCFPTIS
jgi:hypothetical protein